MILTADSSIEPKESPYLANWALGERECDPGSSPPLGQHVAAAMQMKDVAAFELK